MDGKREKRARVSVVTEPGPRTHFVTRFISTTFILGLVGYVALYLAARTDGFRSFAQDYLGERLGVPVHIGKARATPALNVFFENLTSLRSNDEVAASFRADRVDLRWSLANGFRPEKPILREVEIKGLTISFAPAAAGGWEPAAFEPLAVRLAEWSGFEVEAPPAADLASAAEPEEKDTTRRIGPAFWDGCSVLIRDSRMLWWGRGGEEQAFAEGVEFESTPIAVPSRDLQHFRLSIESARASNGRRLKDYDFELLRTGSHNIVLACGGDVGMRPAGTVGTAPPAAGPDSAANAPQLIEGGAGDVAAYIRRELERAAE
jgi:hypothetical protein